MVDKKRLRSVQEELDLPAVNGQGLVLLPRMITKLEVSGEHTQVIRTSVNTDGLIFLFSDPGPGAEEAIGTICLIQRANELPGGSLEVILEGIVRGRLEELGQEDGQLWGRVSILVDLLAEGDPSVEPLLHRVLTLFFRYAALVPWLREEDVGKLRKHKEDADFVADFIPTMLYLEEEDRFRLLYLPEVEPRLELLAERLQDRVEELTVEREIQSKAALEMDRAQRQSFLQAQMQVIQNELGEAEGEDEEIREYRSQLAKLKLPDEIRQKFSKEIDRLGKHPYNSAEASVQRNYLDTCMELPWGKKTKERLDVQAVRKALDKDHYGLEKVKERILEYLAVKQLAPDLKGQILCLVGPPGVGKTSIALSIARATGRKMARVALGGIHDEAEIRGHRKTYVGAMPGRIVSGVGKAGSMNPILVLDEIDKLANDQRGDPASAMLEVLDPEQNNAFRDHFLEVPFDLSDVMFLTTANTTDTIPRPLLDRMEIIRLPSYTDEEKVCIARDHLLPKQLARHGLKKSQLRIKEEALRSLIAGYTLESGVRNLERELATLCRKTAMKLVMGEAKSVTITEADLPAFLGPRRFHPERKDHSPRLGVVNGLAWTSVGGELLEVEANTAKGEGKLILTGNLGEVMKESCSTALSYIRSHCKELGVPEDFHKTLDIHIHFPEGATPKDGPSAGVAITTALVSVLTGREVRGDVAMTGEVTLRGRVLAIGGLREKSMGALREGVHTILLPEENLPDLEEIDPLVREKLHFIPASDVTTVLDTALLPAKEQGREEN